MFKSDDPSWGSVRPDVHGSISLAAVAEGILLASS